MHCFNGRILKSLLFNKHYMHHFESRPETRHHWGWTEHGQVCTWKKNILSVFACFTWFPDFSYFFFLFLFLWWLLELWKGRNHITTSQSVNWAWPSQISTYQQLSEPDTGVHLLIKTMTSKYRVLFDYFHSFLKSVVYNPAAATFWRETADANVDLNLGKDLLTLILMRRN